MTASPTPAAGPSGGILGTGGGMLPMEILEKHPGIAKALVTTGKYPRAGHDRARWEGIDWSSYRARVGIGGRSGPWRIWAHEIRPGDPANLLTDWVAEAEGLPPAPPGVYTELLHDDRGLVMSDIPGEIAGCLPFLDHAATVGRGKFLIAGLGLGIVPAWLLAFAAPWRIDVVEIDPGVIALTTAAARACEEPGKSWADDPRLHVHQADAHTWWPVNRRGCALHDDCELWANATWHAGWFDIYDLVSPHNLPSMTQLEDRFAPRCARTWSWERPECEAMLARGQVLEHPLWCGTPLWEEGQADA